MNWIAALVGSGLTGLLVVVLLFLSRNWILERLKRSIKHEYDTKLANLEADLRRRDREIADLRSAALQALTTRQSGVEARRLRAVDELIEALFHLRAGILLSQLLSNVNFEETCKRSRDPKVAQFIDGLFSTYDSAHKSVLQARPGAAQLYVSPLAWALYSAYSSIITFDIMRVTMLRQRFVEGAKFLKSDAVIDLVKAALPDQTAQIEHFREQWFPYALQDIEKRLMVELREIVGGRDSDAEQVARAAAISQALKPVEKSIAEAAAKQAQSDVSAA